MNHPAIVRCQICTSECQINKLAIWSRDPNDLDPGVQGIMTNHPDILNKVVDEPNF